MNANFYQAGGKPVVTVADKRRIMRAAATAAKKELPEGWGLILICAPVDADIPNGGEFISDLVREGCIKLLKQTTERVEKNMIRKN